MTCGIFGKSIITAKMPSKREINQMNEIDIESVQHSNIDEAEMGSLHALHLNENAIAAVRAAMPKGDSAEECMDCCEVIPLARRIAAKGCLRCVYCQTIHERK
jgi:RNA polymerase-binding transcription factor DksA